MSAVYTKVGQEILSKLIQIEEIAHIWVRYPGEIIVTIGMGGDWDAVEQQIFAVLREAILKAAATSDVSLDPSGIIVQELDLDGRPITSSSTTNGDVCKPNEGGLRVQQCVKGLELVGTGVSDQDLEFVTKEYPWLRWLWLVFCRNLTREVCVRCFLW
jgi:hypothetical protein